MAKPSVVLASLAIVFGIGLIAIEGAGLGLFLGKYNDQLSVIVSEGNTTVITSNFLASAALTSFFVPLLGLIVILLGSISLCCLSSSEPSQSSRCVLGCCWLSLALLMIGGLAVSILVLFLNSLLSIFFDCREGDGDCDTLFNIGQYLSIACAVLCGLVVICGFSLCCLGCFCQRADEDEETMVVRVI